MEEHYASRPKMKYATNKKDAYHIDDTGSWIY